MTPNEIALLTQRFDDADRRADERHDALVEALGKLTDEVADAKARISTIEVWKARWEGAQAVLGSIRGGALLLAVTVVGVVAGWILSHF